MTDDSDKSLFNQYSDQFLRGMSKRMRDSCSSYELKEFFQERFAFFREAIRRNGMVRVRKYKIPRVSLTAKNQSSCVVVEIVSPDAPFIVVTVEALMRKLDLKIIKDKGNFIGGICIIKDEKVIVVNKMKPLEQRLRVLANSFLSYNLDDIYMVPALRAYIEQFRSFHM